MWFTTRETSLTTIDLNALHGRSPRLVSKKKQSGRSKRQPPKRRPQMETLVIVCGEKAKQNETPTSVLHHVGWSVWPFFSCDDESIVNTSVIMKTLQIHRTADTSILAFTGCAGRSNHCPHWAAKPWNAIAVQASFPDVIGDVISQAGVTDTAGTTLPFQDGWVLTA